MSKQIQKESEVYKTLAFMLYIQEYIRVIVCVGGGGVSADEAQSEGD